MMTESEGRTRVQQHQMGMYRSRLTGMYVVFYPEDKNPHSAATEWDDIEDAVINAGKMRRARDKLYA